MIVRVNVHDNCTKEELDSLLADSAGVIDYDSTLLSDGTYDVYAHILFNKCSVIKLFALKNYARKKKDKVEVKVLKNEKKKC